MLSRVQNDLQPIYRAGSADAGTANPAAAVAARVEVFRDLASAEPHWRRLEASGTLTPYQRYDYLRLWQRHIGDADGVVPLIVVALAADNEPLCLLPLGKFSSGPLTVARFLGAKHVNYNFGPWRTGAPFGREVVQQLIDAVGAAEPGLAALELCNQPLRWHGTENPFTQFPHQPSPSTGYRLRLGEPGEAVLARQLTTSYRGRIRGKEKKLAKLDGYRYFVAASPDEVARCMDAFFSQKRIYMATHGIPNPFDDAGVEAFLRAAALAGIETGKPVLEIHALEGGGEVLALYAALTDDKRFTTMISSYTSSENGRQSPGIITLSHAVANAAGRGFEIMDLGVGEAEYKFVYCDETEDLFDSFLPLSASGQLLAPLLRARSGLKRYIKTTPALWRTAQTVRGIFNR